jgi:hypothetical protein
MNSDLDLKPDRYGKVSLHGGRAKRLLKWIDDMEYDGMTGLLNSKRFSTIADWASPLYREAWRGFAEFTDSDRYLLPQRAEWLDVDALLDASCIHCSSLWRLQKRVFTRSDISMFL